MLDPIRFRYLWRRLGGRGDADTRFARLSAAYSEPQRHYHNVAHLIACLGQLDLARGFAERPDEVETALWFHDAVYDPHTKDNEERSAAWAVGAMNDAGIAAEAIARVEAMVLATRHDVEPLSRDGELMLDIDLSILGRGPDEFAEYERAIRAEYVWVPVEQYRPARAAVLQRFLLRPAIYRTAFFRDRFEAPARRNLERSIAEPRY